MSYSSWLLPSATSGSGDATVNVSANVHTGRTQRSTTMTFSAANCADVQVTCNQTGATEFVSFDSTTASVVKAGATVTITGKSNSSKLTFSLGATNNIPLVLPSTYTAAGSSTTNGAEVSGDPGTTAQYAFSIAFTVAENADVTSKSSQLIVTDNAGNTSTITVTQAAADAFLNITPTTITIPAAGTAQTVTVDSNTSWTIA